MSKEAYEAVEISILQVNNYDVLTASTEGEGEDSGWSDYY